MSKLRTSCIIETLKRIAHVLGTAAFCVLVSLAIPLVEAGKPNSNPKVSVEIRPFLDVAGDRPVLEEVDGGGVFAGWQPYTDGIDGVEAQIWAGGSEDVTLRLYDSPRKFNVRYTCWDPVSRTICPGVYESPVGWFMNIRQIGKMAPGEIRLTDAHIAIEPSKNVLTSFNWCGSGTCQGTGLLVAVVKDESGWTVSSLDLDNLFAGQVAPIAELTRRTPRAAQSLGFFQVTFQLRITPLQ